MTACANKTSLPSTRGSFSNQFEMGSKKMDDYKFSEIDKQVLFSGIAAKKNLKADHLLDKFKSKETLNKNTVFSVNGQFPFTALDSGSSI